MKKLFIFLFILFIFLSGCDNEDDLSYRTYSFHVNEMDSIVLTAARIDISMKKSNDNYIKIECLGSVNSSFKDNQIHISPGNKTKEVEILIPAAIKSVTIVSDNSNIYLYDDFNLDINATVKEGKFTARGYKGKAIISMVNGNINISSLGLHSESSMYVEDGGIFLEGILHEGNHFLNVVKGSIRIKVHDSSNTDILTCISDTSDNNIKIHAICKFGKVMIF